MKKTSPKSQVRESQFCCECESANCDIGAHERCHSPKCQMPKWKDVKGKPTRGGH